jgi:hypothetical protein
MLYTKITATTPQSEKQSLYVYVHIYIYIYIYIHIHIYIYIQWLFLTGEKPRQKSLSVLGCFFSFWKLGTFPKPNTNNKCPERCNDFNAGPLCCGVMICLKIQAKTHNTLKTEVASQRVRPLTVQLNVYVVFCCICILGPDHHHILGGTPVYWNALPNTGVPRYIYIYMGMHSPISEWSIGGVTLESIQVGPKISKLQRNTEVAPRMYRPCAEQKTMKWIQHICVVGFFLVFFTRHNINSLGINPGKTNSYVF